MKNLLNLFVNIHVFMIKPKMSKRTKLWSKIPGRKVLTNSSLLAFVLRDLIIQNAILFLCYSFNSKVSLRKSAEKL